MNRYLVGIMFLGKITVARRTSENSIDRSFFKKPRYFFRRFIVILVVTAPQV